MTQALARSAHCNATILHNASLWAGLHAGQIAAYLPRGGPVKPSVVFAILVALAVVACTDQTSLVRVSPPRFDLIQLAQDPELIGGEVYDTISLFQSTNPGPRSRYRLSMTDANYGSYGPATYYRNGTPRWGWFSTQDATARNSSSRMTSPGMVRRTRAPPNSTASRTASTSSRLSKSPGTAPATPRRRRASPSLAASPCWTVTAA
jgi:hypothetical protein